MPGKEYRVARHYDASSTDPKLARSSCWGLGTLRRMDERFCMRLLAAIERGEECCATAVSTVGNEAS